MSAKVVSPVNIRRLFRRVLLCKAEVNVRAFHFPNRKLSQPTPPSTDSALPVWFLCGQKHSLGSCPYLLGGKKPI